MNPPEMRLADAPPRHLLPALLHRWTWTMAWRDSRSRRRRLAVFALAVVAGVAALTAIHCLKRSVEEGVRQQAKALLGSDLLVSARQPFTPEQTAALTARAAGSSREVTFSSMMAFPRGEVRLVQVRGVDGQYPFYGTVETRPANAWGRLQQEPGVVLEPSLMDQFGLRIGDTVTLGAAKLQVLGVILKPAPRSSRFSAFAPEAYLSLPSVEASGLTAGSSLVFHNLHLLLPDPAQADLLKTEHRGQGWRMETPKDREDSLGRAIGAFQQFLGIIAMVALILGAIGVAGAIQAHLARRTASIAVLRCLGCPAQAAFAVYLLQSLVLGLAGAVAGGLLGVALHGTVLRLAQGSLPLEVPVSPEWGTALVTTAVGWAVCTAFALIPLSTLSRVTPARALRGQLDVAEGEATASPWRGRLSMLLAGAVLLAMLLVLAVLNIPDPRRAVGMVTGLAVVLLALAGVARALVWLARRAVRPSWPYLPRQGLSNLHRPRNQTLLFLFSLGLGAFLLLTVLLARDAALNRISLARLQDSPNIYLVDVQADQVAGVSDLVRSLRLPVLESAPIITMRITAVKGVPVRELEKQGRVPRWILQREFRSSHRDRLNATETIVAGEWTTDGSPLDGAVPMSLEEEIAGDLGVGLGDVLDLDVQGVPVKARVTSLRRVDWSRFNLNFFMLFPPGVLDSAPGFHVITARTSPGLSSGALQRALVRDFPNVSAIDLSLILETVGSILNRVSAVIQFVVAFTLAAGLAIIAGTLLNGRDQRVRESALLRTLGASSAQIRVILSVEYAMLGFFSGLAGAVLAVLAHIPLALLVFESPPLPSSATLVLTIIVASTVLSLAAGWLLGRGVTVHTPLETLRAEA